MVDKSFEIAWCAGLFEGEGCISGTKQRPGQIRLDLNMTDYDVISRFAGILGGNLKGPYVKLSKYSKLPRWAWYTSRRDLVTEILDAFWPYLCERRRSKAIVLGYVPHE